MEKNFIKVEDGEWYQQECGNILKLKKFGDIFIAGLMMFREDGSCIECNPAEQQDLVMHVEKPSICSKPKQELSGRVLYVDHKTNSYDITCYPLTETAFKSIFSDAERRFVRILTEIPEMPPTIEELY